MGWLEDERLFLRWRGGVCAVAGRPASGQAPSWRELVRRRQSECSQTGSRRLFSMRNEMMSRRAERSNEAKESSRAVGGADDREKCQWQSGCPCTAAGKCSTAPRVPSEGDQPVVRPSLRKEEPTRVLSAPESVGSWWSVKGGGRSGASVMRSGDSRAGAERHRAWVCCGENF